MAASNIRRRLPRIAALVVLFAALFSLTRAQAVIPPSTFEGDDGNTVAGDNGGTKDWANIAVVKKDDLATGSNDDSLKGQEDHTTVKVTSGSIQDNKSDLLSYRFGNETVGGQDFLYLAWDRMPDDSGTVNIDFELNQASQGAAPAPTAPGADWPLHRTVGDLLITFDLTRGGGVPVLAMLTWLTGADDDCYSPSSKVPCWGDRIVLNPTSTPAAEAAVNPGDDIVFGEASINLQGAGVFETGVCTNFGSVYAKSRSSDSFSAELSDVILPSEVSVNNCGDLQIVKNTGPLSSNNGTFTFDVDCTDDAFDASNVSITTTSGTGSATIADIPNGTTCTVTEDAAPGWTVTTQNPQSTTIAGNRTVTFANTRNVNAIAVDKTSSTASATPGTLVTYTYVITSTGPDALANVTVVDDKCSPVTYASGDTDGDTLLDTSEAWSYTCVSAANAGALTNTATASGVDPAGARVEATDKVTISVVEGVIISQAGSAAGAPATEASAAPTALAATAAPLPRTGSEAVEWASLGGAFALLGFSLMLLSKTTPTAS